MSGEKNEKELLVKNIRRGDTVAEDSFYRHYYPLTFSFVKSLVREPVVAEDLAQETMLKVLVKLRSGSIEQAESLPGYVRQTARYIVIGWYRRKGNQSHDAFDDSIIDAREKSGEELLFVHERRRVVLQLIESLDVARDREILERRYLHDEDKSEICREIDLSSKNFDRIISRARIRFRKLAVEREVDGLLAC